MGKQNGARRRKAEYVVMNTEQVHNDARRCNVERAQDRRHFWEI